MFRKKTSHQSVQEKGISIVASRRRVQYQGPDSYREGVLITINPAIVWLRSQIPVKELTLQCLFRKSSHQSLEEEETYIAGLQQRV